MSVVKICGAAVGAEAAERPLKLAVEQNIQPLGHPDGVLLHIPADSFQCHAHQRVFVKVDDELLVGILHGKALRAAVHKVPQHGVQQFI